MFLSLYYSTTMTNLAPSVLEAGLPIEPLAESLSLLATTDNVVQRVTVRCPVANSSTIGPSTLIQFRFRGGADVFDLTSARITWGGMSCSSTTNTVRFMNGFPIAYSMELKLNEQSLAIVNDADLVRVMAHFARGDTVNVSEATQGYGTAAQRQLWGATARDYSIPLGSYFVGAHSFPAFTHGSELTLEVQLAAAVDCMETATAATVPTYTGAVASTYLSYDALVIRPEAKKAFLAPFTNADGSLNPIPFMFKTWRTSSSVVLAAATDAELVSSIRSASLTDVWAIARPQATLSTLATLNRIEDYRFPTLLSLQLDLNGVQYPSQRVLCTAANGFEAYSYVMRQLHHSDALVGPAYGASPVDQSLISVIGWTGTLASGIDKCLLAWNVQRNDTGEPNHITGVDTSQASSDLRIRLTFTNVPVNETYTIISWMQVRVMRLPSGSIIVQR